VRKLIVSNFVTLDGLYEGKDKSISSLFDYYHEDYANDDIYDFYNVELTRAADFLLLSRNSFLANKAYWPVYPMTPGPPISDVKRRHSSSPLKKS
jgi:hypothetical protein